jgi:hypothetical protein
MPPVVLNDKQSSVLRWIGDGCPDGVMEGYHHRVSAAALRSRDLVRIRGRGPSWHAELTERGKTSLPLSRGDDHQQHAENDLQNADPDRGFARAVGVRLISREEDERSQDREREHPAREERGTGHTPPGGCEHQDDGDDRQGAEGHAHCQRDDLPDCPTHDSVSPARERLHPIPTPRVRHPLAEPDQRAVVRG